ncbi:MAG: hypothetical protein OXF88_22490 [Rhodobacteraceae bacterium]|nr:hypothetical protein [Paracoccaceae bacterium]MCY4137228.1 hypothetical protein [Paracoccaceae bacterium]
MSHTAARTRLANVSDQDRMELMNPHARHPGPGVQFEDALAPFRSLALTWTRGKPDAPAEQPDWPLVRHLG